MVCLAVSPGKHAVCQTTMVVPLWDSEGSDGQDESTDQPENGTKVTKRRHVQLQINNGRIKIPPEDGRTHMHACSKVWKACVVVIVVLN